MASPSFESTYHHFYTTSTSNLLLRNFPAAYDNAQSLLLLCSKSSLQSDELQTVWERWASVREEQIKAVKLNITVLTSIYIDAITNIGRPSLNQAGKAENYSVVLSELLSRLIKGSLNKEKVGSLVNHLVTSTTSSLNPSTPSASSISQSPHLSALSPPLLETLLLSLLKLSSSLPSTIASRKPKSSSSKTLEADFLERGRTLFEDWLAQIQSDLSDEDLDALYHPRRHHESESLSSSTASHPSSSASSHPVSSPSPTATVLSKAYKSSLRLYVLEFLPRLGEWELAREIVCGGLVRGAGEKEVSLTFVIGQPPGCLDWVTDDAWRVVCATADIEEVTLDGNESETTFSLLFTATIQTCRHPCCRATIRQEERSRASGRRREQKIKHVRRDGTDGAADRLPQACIRGSRQWWKTDGGSDRVEGDVAANDSGGKGIKQEERYLRHIFEQGSSAG